MPLYIDKPLKWVNAYVDGVTVDQGSTYHLSWDEIEELVGFKAERMTVSAYYLVNTEQAKEFLKRVDKLVSIVEFIGKPEAGSPEAYNEYLAEREANERMMTGKVEKVHKARTPKMPKPEPKKYVVPAGNWVCPTCGCDYAPAYVKTEWIQNCTCEAWG